MDKLKLHTPDLTAQNIEKLAALFPNCVTETTDAKGTLKRGIDFDQLRQELSDHVVEGPRERYHLDWPGKREALLAANAPIAKTLRPCREESVDFDTTKNLFIEGDNLDALKLLQETYLGKVKLIYIDPPYNTGNDFIYDDDFADDAQSYKLRTLENDDVGNRMVANTESNGRYHSDWLRMIYCRLKLARNLLSDHGIIFVSIGQEEIGNTLSVCSEIFGRENFVTICSRVMKKGGQKGTHFSPCVDYIVGFAKSINELNPFREEISQNLIDEVYTRIAEDGPRKGERYRSMGLYQAMLEKRANQRFYIECPDGTFVIPPGRSFPDTESEGAQVTPSDGDGVWRWTYPRFRDEKLNNNIQFVKSDRTSLVKPDGSAAEWNVYYRIWLSDRLEDGQLPGNILEKFESRHSSAELKALDIPFDYAKPSALIKFLMTISCVKDGEITLDFFAGSGSSAHAAIELAAQSGKRLPFVTVQLPAPTREDSDEFKQGYRTISEITKERIRRAGATIKADNATTAPNLDIGFRVLKIDTSNMKDVYYTPDAVKQDQLELLTDNIKEDRTPEDLLFQVLVDWGVDLALPITQETIVKKKVFFVDGNALAACFDPNITEELVKELAKKKPLRAVFRDSSYGSDSVKINVEQIFKLLSPGTELKSL
jgi:adenine-specific DNA-methyltransferase